MKIDTNNIFSISEANQNFSKIAKAVDKNGNVVILKNNKPKYVIKPFDSAEREITDDERLEIIAGRILKEHRHAFEVLAQ